MINKMSDQAMADDINTAIAVQNGKDTGEVLICAFKGFAAGFGLTNLFVASRAGVTGSGSGILGAVTCGP